MGLIYIIVAQFFWALELILIRKFLPNQNSIAVSAITAVIGAIFYLPTFLFVKQKFYPKDYLVLIILGLTSWVIAQACYITGIQKGASAYVVTLATLTMPLMTFIMAAVFLKEALTIKIVLGGMIMIIGFLIISL